MTNPKPFAEKMNSRRIICAGTLLAMATFFGDMAKGQVQQLIITENSSTSLTATLNGVPQTVIKNGANKWFIETDGVVGEKLWQEPGEPEFNSVVGQGGRISIVSDFSDPGATGLHNGTKDKMDFKINGAELDVTLQDGPTVPDTATTLPLLSLALAALGLAKRRLF
jgi:hypothetical protein